MTRVDFPNKTGDYNVDGVSIIILPDKIIIDTGMRQTTTGRISGGYPTRKSASAQKEKKEKKTHSILNDMLDNAQEFVMPGSTKRR